MMMMKLDTRVLAPEPEVSGGGAEMQQQVTDASPQQQEAAPADDVNPFAFDDSEPQDAEPEDGQEQEVPQDADDLGEFDWSELSYSDGEKKMLDDICSEVGVHKGKMSKVLKLVQDEARRELQSATDELRRSWGNAFSERVHKTQEFIKRFAKSAGWSQEQMNQFANPRGYALFYDVMRLTGERRSSTAARAVVHEQKPRSLETVRGDIRDVENQWFAARKDKNNALMRQLSDRHVELMTEQKKLMGTYDNRPAPRVLHF